MGLYGGRSARELTLSDAIMTGFRMATKVNFVVPILVIGVIVNVIVYAAFVPLIIGMVAGKGTDGTAIGGAFVVGILSAVIAGTIGGVLLNLYGQVWATLASVGAEPTIQATFTRIGQRWIAILGAGIVVAVVGLAFLIIGGVLFAALGPIGFIAFLAAIVGAIYVGARLSLAGWLAADGADAMDAVRTSWLITSSKVLLIIGWGVAAGFVFAVVGAVLSAILGILPIVGTALATAIGSAFGYGSSVTIYRKVTAPEAAAVPAGEAATPVIG